MMKVIINYAKLSSDKLMVKAEDVAAGLTGNANFPEPPVNAAEIITQMKSLGTALVGANTGNKAMKVNARKQKVTLADMLRQDAVYANFKSNDEEKLMSTGFTLTKRPEKHGLPAAVRNLNAEFTNIAGTINLTWRRSPLAKTYNVFISNNGGQTWTMFKTTYGRKVLCDSLTSNTRYQFKVVAANQVGSGIDSDIVTQVAA